jgi:hypothetical protein
MVIKGDIRIFPGEVKDLLHGLATEDFFADGILCGSWVMLGYRYQHQLMYALHTEDIDAIEAARDCVADRTVPSFGEPCIYPTSHGPLYSRRQKGLNSLSS